MLTFQSILLATDAYIGGGFVNKRHLMAWSNISQHDLGVNGSYEKIMLAKFELAM